VRRRTSYAGHGSTWQLAGRGLCGLPLREPVPHEVGPVRSHRADVARVEAKTGEQRRQSIKEALATGDTEDMDDWLRQDSLNDGTREYIGRVHPMFMGGGYLPDYRPGEVGIARVALKSIAGKPRRGKNGQRLPEEQAYLRVR
jgi:hypothetical protein